MQSNCPALAEPLLFEAAPRSVCCGAKVFLRAALLIGLGYAAVLSVVIGTDDQRVEAHGAEVLTDFLPALHATGRHPMDTSTRLGIQIGPGRPENTVQEIAYHIARKVRHIGRVAFAKTMGGLLHDDDLGVETTTRHAASKVRGFLGKLPERVELTEKAEAEVEDAERQVAWLIGAKYARERAATDTPRSVSAEAVLEGKKQLENVARQMEREMQGVSEKLLDAKHLIDDTW